MSSIKVTTAILVLTGAICASAARAQVPEACELVRLTGSDDPSGIFGFASAVAIDGDVLVVGASDDDTVFRGNGAAYIFEREGITWVERAKLIASNLVGDDLIGASVSIDGDRLVVGGPQNFPLSSGPGKAFVFRREGNGWVEEQQLVSSGSSTFDWYGFSVSISGDRVVVGAPEEGLSAGRAYVFRREGTMWTEEAALAGSEIVSGDNFATSVALDGDLMVVGARRDFDAGEEAGSAYVFAWEGGKWVQAAKLLAGDAAPGDRFGVSVAIHADTVLVGADATDANGTNSGSVYVFAPSGGSWDQVAKLTASDSGSLRLGGSLAIEANLLLVGAWGHDHAGPESGAAYLFRHDGAQWIEQQRLVASDARMSRVFGASVGLSGGSAVVGPVFAYVFAVGGDCDENGLTDACEIADGTVPDCNANAVPDDCDIADGTSTDSDGDGMPDECPKIPAVSQWALVVMALLVMVGATIRIRRTAIDS